MAGGRPNKQRAAGGDPLLALAAAGIVVLVAAAVMLAWAAAAAAGVGHGSPTAWLLDRDHTGRWVPAATWWAVAFGLPVVALVAAAGYAVARVLSRRRWTDGLAGSMSSRRDLVELQPAAVAAQAARLGAEAAGGGVRLGRAVLTGGWLHSTYEWSQLWIMGTRAGKTTAAAATMLVEHSGAALATSNKPDLVELTRGPRSELGRVWINDPQGLYGEGATWWWNPLSFVTSTGRAEQLAQMWMASRSDTDRVGHEDPYFGPQGLTLLADLLLAAAVGGEPVTRVLDWLNYPLGRAGLVDPEKILKQAGLPAVADNIHAKIAGTAPEERSGIYGTARSAVQFLRSPQFAPWITPVSGPGGEPDTRPQFDQDAFAASRDTLYLLSVQGGGSARAITVALTAAVYAAGEDLAARNGGRVPVPVLFVLDEAGNVCRWPELPNLYNYAGSRGLVLVTILQSHKLGEQAWGANGFGMMVSAANVMVVGRGINDDAHLTALSRLIGDRQYRDRSVTAGTGQRSTSHTIREERIFTEADLRALPPGRAILFVAGSRPILLELVPWWDRECGPLVAASKAAYHQVAALETAAAATASIPVSTPAPSHAVGRLDDSGGG